MNTTTVGSQLYADTNFSRAEDLKLIQGLGHFTADQSYPGELHLFVIRSQYPHARITRMDLSQVESAPGVKWVMTAKDIEAHGGKDLPSASLRLNSKSTRLVKMPMRPNSPGPHNCMRVHRAMCRPISSPETWPRCRLNLPVPTM